MQKVYIRYNSLYSAWRRHKEVTSIKKKLFFFIFIIEIYNFDLHFRKSGMKRVFRISSVILFFSLIIFSNYSVLYSQDTIIYIPDENWNLWVDQYAKWSEDELYLTDEYSLKEMKLNPPTGGWNVLKKKEGKQVVLPSTVEESYWGEFGYRKFNPEEYENSMIDSSVQNGAYIGASWWYTFVDIPESYKDKKIFINFTGMRQRAELYVNGKIVGYNIIDELPFKFNITPAALIGGSNLIALRITNPGGRYGAKSNGIISWGANNLHSGRGFSGLNSGIYLDAKHNQYIDELFVLNSKYSNTINAVIKIKNESAARKIGNLRLEIADNQEPNIILLESMKEVIINPGETFEDKQEFKFFNATLWSIENPKLYTLKANVEFIEEDSKEIKVRSDSREISFGFRWFDIEGLGGDAIFKLNGERIKIYSANSYGYWGLNGLWGAEELSIQDAVSAKKLGLNCIEARGFVDSKITIKAFDSIGVFRIINFDAGRLALGDKYNIKKFPSKGSVDTRGYRGEPISFGERLIQEKILRTMKEFKSSPSVIMYCIDGDLSPDLNNPRIFNLLRKMHQEDPSRIILLKNSVCNFNQVWMAPYDDRIYFDDGDGKSGYFAIGNVSVSDSWQDYLYSNSGDYIYNYSNKEEILSVKDIEGTSIFQNLYLIEKKLSKLPHIPLYAEKYKKSLESIKRFFEKWEFKRNTDFLNSFFIDLTSSSFDYYGRIAQNIRINDDIDLFSFGDWDSPFIGDNGGIVNIFRELNGNGDLLSSRLKKVVPIIKPRKLVYELGKKPIIDVYFINETNKKMGNELKLFLTDPSGIKRELYSFIMPPIERNKFSYKISEEFDLPESDIEGEYIIRAELSGVEEIFCEEKFYVINSLVYPSRVPKTIGVISNNSKLINSLKKELPVLNFEKYDYNKNYDLLLINSISMNGKTRINNPYPKLQGIKDIDLYLTEDIGNENNLEYQFESLPNGKARVIFKFAEFSAGPGERIFDVAINDKIVISDLDIAVRAINGGIFDTAVIADVLNGYIKISIPKRKKNYAKLNAFKIEIEGKTIAINCGGGDYVDSYGVKWKAYEPNPEFDNSAIQKIKSGTPAIFLAEGEKTVSMFSKILSREGAISYKRNVGYNGTNGKYFFRKHPVLEGLPVDNSISSYYQISSFLNDGVLLDGVNIDVFAGYISSVPSSLGAALFTANLGKGKVLFSSVPGLLSSLTGYKEGLNELFAKRILLNSIDYLTR